MSDFLENIRPRIKERADKIAYTSNLTNNTVDFCEIFKQSNRSAVIAEIKFSSPSHGRIYPGNLDHVQIAAEYLRNGASALSVLTESTVFEGNMDFIRDIRRAFPAVPILAKDFVLSQSQINEALCYGANAILLIVAFLDKVHLKLLYHYAISLGLTAILEVHDMQELETALQLNPPVIGFNNRNLSTLDIDLGTSRQLIQHVPRSMAVICESGIENSEQLNEMQKLGFKGFLIGSMFMKHSNPGIALKKLLRGEYDES